MFGKKPSIPGERFFTEGYLSSMFVLDQMKAHNRELRQTDRELVRDRHKLEAEEQRLVRNEISSMEARGNLFRSTKYERMHRVAIRKYIE